MSLKAWATLGPIKKFLWKRKYKHKIVRCIHTTHFLQTVAKLELWSPSAEEAFTLAGRVILNATLSSMVNALKNMG